MFVDRAEAVGNIEMGLTAVLNGFHSLIDADATPGRNWYDEPSVATVLTLRNARHHNKAHKVRTLYKYHSQEAKHIDRMEMYVLLNFKSPDPTATTFEVYQSWLDLKALLAMDPKESRITTRTNEAISKYLSVDKFAGYAAYYGQTEARVFFNTIPLIVNAGMSIVPAIGTRIRPLSTESEFFLSHFGDPEFADTQRPEVNCGPFVLPK